MATITKLQRRQGVVYKARVRSAGLGKEISRTFKTRSSAERWARKLESALIEESTGLITESQKHTVRDAIERYRAEVLPTRASTTSRNYAQHLSYWQQQLGQLRLSELTPQAIAHCRDALLNAPVTSRTGTAKPRSPNTVARYLATLQAVLSACVSRWHWLPVSPLSQVEKPAAPNSRTRFLSRSELQRLLMACQTSASPDLYLSVVLSVTCGMRQGELLALRWQDVNLETSTLLLRVDNETRTKGSVRSAHVPSQVISLLQARKTAAPDPSDNALVFPSRVSKHRPVDLRTPFRTALKRANIEGFRWHDLRHSAASFMAGQGASLLEIGAVLGHRSVQTSKRYAHLTEQRTNTLIQSVADRTLGEVAE